MMVIKLDNEDVVKWAVYNNGKALGLITMFERSGGLQFAPFIRRLSYDDIHLLYKELTKLALSTGFLQEVVYGYSYIGKEIIRNEDNCLVGTITGSMCALNKNSDKFFKSDLKAVVNFMMGGDK